MALWSLLWYCTEFATHEIPQMDCLCQTGLLTSYWYLVNCLLYLFIKCLGNVCLFTSSMLRGKRLCRFAQFTKGGFRVPWFVEFKIPQEHTLQSDPENSGHTYLRHMMSLPEPRVHKLGQFQKIPIVNKISWNRWKERGFGENGHRTFSSSYLSVWYQSVQTESVYSVEISLKVEPCHFTVLTHI